MGEVTRFRADKSLLPFYSIKPFHAVVCLKLRRPIWGTRQKTTGSLLFSFISSFINLYQRQRRLLLSPIYSHLTPCPAEALTTERMQEMESCLSYVSHYYSADAGNQDFSHSPLSLRSLTRWISVLLPPPLWLLACVCTIGVGVCACMCRQLSRGGEGTLPGGAPPPKKGGMR